MAGEGQEAQFAKWELIVKILKEAVHKAGVPDVTEYKGEPFKNRWHVYKQEFPRDVVLKMYVSGFFGTLHADFHLLKGAVWIYEEAERILNHPDADKAFDISSEEERKEAIYENTRDCLVKYIRYLPLKMYQSLDLALDDSIRSYIRQEVEPYYKEHWEELNLSLDFLKPRADFKEHVDQFEDLRKVIIGEKRPRLTEEDYENLRERYKALRLEYQKARRYHDTSREVFFNGKRNAKDDEWRVKWSSMSVDMFPELLPECLQLLADLNYQPFELATRHLAIVRGGGVAYMRKLLRRSKKRTSDSEVGHLQS